MPKVSKARTVLQEVLASGITKDHVELRVRDWQHRINELYAQLEAWLPEGWTIVRTRRIRMNEPMMKAHKVPGVNLSCLELRGPRGRKLYVRPGCLWVVGFNGLIDVKTSAEHYIIVDVAEILTEPQWHITGMYNRRHESILDRRRFIRLLAKAKS